MAQQYPLVAYPTANSTSLPVYQARSAGLSYASTTKRVIPPLSPRGALRHSPAPIPASTSSPSAASSAQSTLLPWLPEPTKGLSRSSHLPETPQQFVLWEPVFPKLVSYSHHRSVSHHITSPYPVGYCQRPQISIQIKCQKRARLRPRRPTNRPPKHQRGLARALAI